MNTSTKPNTFRLNANLAACLGREGSAGYVSLAEAHTIYRLLCERGWNPDEDWKPKIKALGDEEWWLVIDEAVANTVEISAELHDACVCRQQTLLQSPHFTLLERLKSALWHDDLRTLIAVLAELQRATNDSVWKALLAAAEAREDVVFPIV